MRKRSILALLFGLLAWAGTSARAPAQAAADPHAKSPRKVVYIIPIRGMIEPALLYVVRRGVAEAERQHADAIIFAMDTHGGTVDAARDIVFTIQNIRVPTYTFVEKNAFSAGAIIAMSTHHIYMAPGGVIGDAMPIMMTPFGGVQAMPEALQEKTVSAVSALMRAAAEQGGHDKELAEAMVRRELEFKVGDQVLCPEGQLLTLTNEEAEQPGAKGKPLLSEGTVAGVNALLQRIGLGDAEKREMRVTSSERLARYIAALGPLFLIAGLLGIYIEIKTPGFGLPGILGILSLAVFFWGHHIAGLAGSEDVLLFLAGFALLLVELLALPGFGAIGIAGFVLMLAGLLLAMTERYPGGPWLPRWPQLEVPITKLSLSLIGTAIGGALLARLLPKSRLFRRLILESSNTRTAGYTAAATATDLVGRAGVTLAPLRPSGPAQIGDRSMDVITGGAFLPAGTRVRVVEVHGSRVTVEPNGPLPGSGGTPTP